MNRRDFLKVAGGGLIVLICAPRASARTINGFVHIEESGRVTCLVGKVEMGQDVVTSLAQIVAEELAVPLNRVDVVMGDTARVPYDSGTWGSLSIRAFGPSLRKAAAEARATLRTLAAERLGVPSDRLVFADGAVCDSKAPARRLVYGELLRGARIERKVTLSDLPPFEKGKTMGRSVHRADAHAKVTGAAKYTGDIRVPGMMYAAILRSPDASRLVSLDTSAAEGFRVVREGDLVAVLHPTPDGAERGLSRLKARFQGRPSVLTQATVHAYLVATAGAPDVEFQGGAVDEAKKRATRTLVHTYYDPFLAHAPIETHTALARFEGDHLTVWASTQRPFGVRESLAKALHMPLEKVRVITPFIGGGFGGKASSPQALEAALLARKAGCPVQVMYTRREEFATDAFRPAAVVRIATGLDGKGRIVSWDQTIYQAGARGAEMLYDVADYRISSCESTRSPLETGPWRAPGNNTNTFARESQIDVVAAHLGVDPLAYRLAHTSNKRLLSTLHAAAKHFGWKGATRGHGVACAVDAGTYVTTMAQVAVDRKTGRVHVERLLCAQDMGFVVNPEGARTQAEGGLTMGLGYALTEEVAFRGHQVLSDSFSNYAIPRFTSLPKLDVVLVDNPTHPPQGGGEPAICGVGGAIANAIFNAVGARLHQMPMTPRRVREALGRGT